MDRSAPTEAETLALRKIAGLRSWLFAIAMIGLGVTLWARTIPNPTAQVALCPLGSDVHGVRVGYLPLRRPSPGAHRVA